MINKSRLIKEAKGELSKLGYTQIKDSVNGSDGLFAKLVANDLYLTLGLIISRFYDAKFTASYYLSKSTIWSAVWGDIPRDCYSRVSAHLTKEERYTLLSEEYTHEGVVDGWWDDSGDSITGFITTIKITESRFLGQLDLIDRIEKSVEVSHLKYLSSQLFKEIQNDEEEFIYHFIPLKNIANIPSIWFKAAERVLFKEKSILNVNTVKRLAADAWRQKCIEDTLSS